MNKLFCALKQISVIAFISLVMPSQAVVADSIVQTADSPGKISVETQTRAKLLQDAAAGGIYFPSRTPSTFKANTAAPAAASGASASIISPAAATGTHAETTGPQVLQPPSAQALEVKPIISVPAKSSTPVITESQVAVTGKTDKNLKPFLAVVRANFSAWDQNHDGTIDRKEIEVAAQDAKYTGDAAAALAVLKIDADAKIAAKKELGLSRLSDIDTIQSKSDSGEKIDSDFGKIFARCQYKLKTVPRQLYRCAAASFDDSSRVDPGLLFLS